MPAAEAPVGNTGSKGRDGRLDAPTRQQLAKTIRALRQVVLRRTAQGDPLFGACSRALSLAFVLRRTPVRLQTRPLQIPLPHPMFACRPADGFFAKTKNQRKLSVPFGWCSMEEDQLVGNAIVVIDEVRRGLGGALVREMWLQEMDGLTLPVWSFSLEEKLSRKRRREGSMAPPPAPPVKKARAV